MKSSGPTVRPRKPKSEALTCRSTATNETRHAPGSEDVSAATGATSYQHTASASILPLHRLTVLQLALGLSLSSSWTA